MGRVGVGVSVRRE